jgi:membrane fusion protein (multidrug efflux system)
MRSKWLAVALGVVLLGGGTGAAWMSGHLKWPAADAQAGTDKAAAKSRKDGGSDKPETPLEFAAREVVQPQRTRMVARVEFSGPLVAPGTAVVRARAGGTLLSLAVAEGERVAAGQTLGRIELSELAGRVAERSALVESARATLAQAERQHQSNERLAAQQFISGVALDNSRAAVETARAALLAANASADVVKAGLRDGALVAPIAGIVAKRQALPGEKLAAEQPVLTIVDIARLELAGAVGTHEVARLAPGMPVDVEVEGVDRAVAGRIARIAPAAEPGTRAIGVTIELANRDERLRAGQYAMARVQLPDDQERLTVPMAAVGNTAGQDHVWVIEAGTLARRAVTLGRRDPGQGRVEVLSGVSDASQVLAARFDNLREGAKARQLADAGSALGTPLAAVSAASASQPLRK